jgi:hypothetical protein
MRIAYAGTPEFARVALEALHAAGHEVVRVLTQPDRPACRWRSRAACAWTGASPTRPPPPANCCRPTRPS